MQLAVSIAQSPSLSSCCAGNYIGGFHGFQECLFSLCDDLDVQLAAETVAIGYCSCAPPLLSVIDVTSG